MPSPRVHFADAEQPETGPVRVQFGKAAWHFASLMALRMGMGKGKGKGKVGIVDASAVRAFKFTADRAGRTVFRLLNCADVIPRRDKA